MAIELNQNVSTVIAIGPLVEPISATNFSTFTLAAADAARWCGPNSTTGYNISNYTISASPVVSGMYFIHLSAGTLSKAGLQHLQLTDESAILPYAKDFIVVTSQYWNAKYGTTPVRANVVSVAANAFSAPAIADGALSAAVRSALSGFGLNQLVLSAYVNANVHSGGLFARLMATSGAIEDFDSTDASLEALRDRGDAAWAGSVDINSFVSAIWSAPLADYTAAGTAGANLLSTMNIVSTIQNDGVSVDVLSVASAVWSMPLTPYTAFGQAGERVQSIATQTSSILTDTNELQTDDYPGRFDTLSAAVNVVDGVVNDILTDTNELQSDDYPGRFDTLSAAVGVVDGNVDSILSDTGTDGVVIAAGAIDTTQFAAGAIDAAALAADAGTEIANAVWAKVLESQGSITGQQAMQVILAANVGATISGTSGYQFYTPNSGALRFSVASINANNERSAIKLNV